MTKKVAPRAREAFASVEPAVQDQAPATVPASEPVQAEAVNPTPASAPAPAADKRSPKGEVAEKAADPAAEARARWKRRLGRWQKKAGAQGTDARALMQEALAG
jgi:hypothetical protein